MNIIFLGPPGSGKGTQAKRIAEKLGLAHISTGDVFRAAIGSESELGKEIKGYVDAGKLVPDELVSEVVFADLKKRKDGAGFILDGYPRTVDQAKAFDGFSQRENLKIDAYLFLDVKNEELEKRLSNRQKEEGRADDKPEVVRERLRIYSVQTQPILDLYKDRPEYHAINGEQPVADVFQNIVQVLVG